MKKTAKARKEQFQLCDFYPDTYRIVIQPPTFKSLSQAFSYFTQHKDNFLNNDEGDGDDIPDSVSSPITDVHDSIEFFEDKMRQEARKTVSEPTSGSESAEGSKLFSDLAASERTRGGEEPGEAATAASHPQ